MLLVGVILGAVGGIALSRDTTGAPTHTVDGFFVGSALDPEEAGDGGCETTVGKLRSGQPVRLLNSVGEVVATAPLVGGELENIRRTQETGLFEGTYTSADCRLTFSLIEVPESSSYTVETRGLTAVTYTRDEMVQAGWRMEFRL